MAVPRSCGKITREVCLAAINDNGRILTHTLDSWVGASKIQGGDAGQSGVHMVIGYAVIDPRLEMPQRIISSGRVSADEFSAVESTTIRRATPHQMRFSARSRPPMGD